MVYPPKDAVTHPSTNRARRRVTSFVRRTTLTTTPRRQRCRGICYRPTVAKQHGSRDSQVGNGHDIVNILVFISFLLIFCIVRPFVRSNNKIRVGLLYVKVRWLSFLSNQTVVWVCHNTALNSYNHISAVHILLSIYWKTADNDTN